MKLNNSTNFDYSSYELLRDVYKNGKVILSKDNYSMDSVKLAIKDAFSIRAAKTKTGNIKVYLIY
jgi:hypothetical protein